MIVLIAVGALIVIGALIFIGIATEMFATPLPKREEPEETEEERERLERWRGNAD
ncbi:MAG: hypothetical protein QOI89_38 [Solirubrobacteraceae bacterium]|jgi:hypothetical protein|nr:hypothetical protein [Solirubrobacteraceae bacterium]